MNLCAQIDRHDGVASLGYDDLRWRWDSAWAARIRFVFARLDGAYVIDGVVDREGQRVLPNRSLI